MAEKRYTKEQRKVLSILLGEVAEKVNTVLKLTEREDLSDYLDSLSSVVFSLLMARNRGDVDLALGDFNKLTEYVKTAMIEYDKTKTI